MARVHIPVCNVGYCLADNTHVLQIWLSFREQNVLMGYMGQFY
jgi:hypothetical protein